MLVDGPCAAGTTLYNPLCLYADQPPRWKFGFSSELRYASDAASDSWCDSTLVTLLAVLPASDHFVFDSKHWA